MRIAVLGWYGRGNVGDEAFRLVLAEMLAGHEVRFLSPDEFRQDGGGEVTILGGGDVATPYYLDLLRDREGPVYALGVGLGFESESRLLAEVGFTEVVLRNVSDVARCAECLTCPVSACPDLAFALKPPGLDVLGRITQEPRKPTAGVFLADYVNPALGRDTPEFRARSHEFHRALAHELDWLVGEGFEVLLVPSECQPRADDRRIALDVAAFMRHCRRGGEGLPLLAPLSPLEMLDLMRQLDLAVCMRFHAHVFAMVAGLPFVSIEFTRKSRLLLEENGLESLVGIRFDGSTRFDFTPFRQATSGVLDGRTRIAETLRRPSADKREELRRWTDRIRAEWIGEHHRPKPPPPGRAS